MTILEAALKYQKKGYSVIPVGFDKRPLIKWEPYQKQKATVEEIKAWFKKFPTANIGIVTGEISNLLIVDTDTPESTQRVQEAIPESLVVPCQNTPSGGMHFVFSHAPGFSNRSRVADGIDIRTTGGYFVAAPSINGNGKGWQWVVSLFDAEPVYILDSITSLFNSSSFSFLTRDVTQAEIDIDHNISQVSQSITKYFTEPGRDDDIFHLANAGIKGNANIEILTQALKIIARNCEPPFPEKDVEVKVRSAIDRAKKRERNIMKEVREWVELMKMTSQGGHIKFTTWSQESQSITKTEKHAGRMAFSRLCDPPDPILEKVAGLPGEYKIIDKDDNEQKWWLDEGKPLKLSIPLGAERYAKVFQGNIILLEGQKSQGKSTFSLEFARLNRNLYPKSKIIYQNIEMSDSEIKDRMKSYQNQEIIGMDEWPKFLKIIKQTSNWSDKIEPDSINIIDYLVEYEKAYELPRFIFDIHRKLKTGIALCVVQRDPFKPYPLGGRGTRDIPRLIISLIKHCMRLEDVKSFWPSEFGNPSGIGIKYKQIEWCKWKAEGEWGMTEEVKYDAFEKNKGKWKTFLKED